MVEPNPGRVVWTYDDLRLMPEDGNRYEVVDGELLVTPAPGTKHQTISKKLVVSLVRQIEERGIGRVYHAPIDVITSHTRTVEPDVLVVRTEHLGDVTERGVERAPDLVIEILSPSSIENDRIIKRKLYAAIGVPEYWIVDPPRRTVEVLVPGDGDLRLHATFGASDTLRSAGFDVAIALDALFAP